MDSMIRKQAGFYGKPFAASRGVRQGDIISPMIFNIVTDAVIRESIKIFGNNDPNKSTMIELLFYADDGAIIGEQPQEVQRRIFIRQILDELA
jgi:Reverse transcriptase (RNA-dependent DNA polymerase)